MAHSKTSAAVIKRKQKQAEALRLRVGGADFPSIAKYLSVSLGSAYNYVTRGIAEMTEDAPEHADQIKQMELIRLDKMLLGVQKLAFAGDEKAIQTVLKIMDRRAKYLSLDAKIVDAPLLDDAANTAKIDAALAVAACNGDTAAMKLYYQRFAGFAEKSTVTKIPSIEELRQTAIDKGLDPEEYITTFFQLHAKHGNAGS